MWAKHRRGLFECVTGKCTSNQQKREQLNVDSKGVDGKSSRGSVNYWQMFRQQNDRGVEVEGNFRGGRGGIGRLATIKRWWSGSVECM